MFYLHKHSSHRFSESQFCFYITSGRCVDRCWLDSRRCSRPTSPNSWEWQPRQSYSRHLNRQKKKQQSVFRQRTWQPRFPIFEKETPSKFAEEQIFPDREPWQNSSLLKLQTSSRSEPPTRSWRRSRLCHNYITGCYARSQQSANERPTRTTHDLDQDLF